MATAYVNPYSIALPNRRAAVGAIAKLSPWPFLGLCFYLVSQIYLIPILKVGPNWAAWQMPADVAGGAFVLFALLAGGSKVAPPKAGTKIVYLLSFFFLAGVVSFVVVTIGMARTEFGKGTGDGIFYLYRTAQMVVLFWAALRIPMTEKRIALLHKIVTVVLAISCILCLASYVGALPGPFLARHLSPSGGVSGPWRAYAVNDARGLGTIGFNHAYTAAQIVLLVALRMSLGRKRRPVSDTLFILLGLATCFASGSRAGLAAMGFFSLAIFIRNPIYVPFVGILLGVASLFTTPEQLNTKDIQDTTDKVSAIFNPQEASQFQARLRIWEYWTTEFQQDPSLLVTGAGFGGSRNYAQVPHMLYLTVLAEFGLMGLAAYLYFTFYVTRNVLKSEVTPKPFFWGIIALLLASFTQETFYPVSAMGHFLCLFFVGVAVILRVRQFEDSNRPAALPRRGRRALLPVSASPMTRYQVRAT